MDGEGAARYIKSTNSKNTNTPIIAVSAYSGTDPNETSNVFSASLSKPLQKADLLGSFPRYLGIFGSWFMAAVMRQLGFKTSAMRGGAVNYKVTASHQVSWHSHFCSRSTFTFYCFIVHLLFVLLFTHAPSSCRFDVHSASIFHPHPTHTTIMIPNSRAFPPAL